MNAIVFTNPAAGSKADAIDELRSALESAGVKADVRQVPGDQITAAAKKALSEKPDAIVAAGGDGTVSAVASALAGTPQHMGVLPTGTLNHFAKDMNIPTELAEAARVIAAGNIRPADVGEVNGRVFINNSSIGLYPHIVGDRERQQERLGRGKWHAMARATISVFRRHPTVSVRIETNGQSTVRTTPFVFVGNNCYEMDMTTIGQRKRLDGGELALYYSHRSGRFALLRLAMRAVVGRLEQSADFESVTTEAITIESHHRNIRIAIDGETTRMSPPLRFRIRKAALQVLAPPPGQGE